MLTIETAKVFEPLLQPARFKGAWGGRGGGKSHFFGELLVERCLLTPGTLAVCIREVQKTLSQSSKRLIETKIAELGVGSQFRVLYDRIETPVGGLIIFQGMQDATAESIKSLEGYQIAWVEEAQTLSARSLALLRPTIRAEGSEIWFSWNPRRKSDAVDEFLRVNQPDNAIVVKANWRDNAWFPSVLRRNVSLISPSTPTAITMCGKASMHEPSRAATLPQSLVRSAKRDASAKSQPIRSSRCEPFGILAAPVPRPMPWRWIVQ